MPDAPTDDIRDQYRYGTVYRRKMFELLDEHWRDCGLCRLDDDPEQEERYWKVELSIREGHLREEKVEWDPDIRF